MIYAVTAAIVHADGRRDASAAPPRAARRPRQPAAFPPAGRVGASQGGSLPQPAGIAAFGRRLGLLLALGLLAGCSPATPSGASSALPEVGPAAGASLCDRIDAVLAHTRDRRRLDAAVHGAWQVVHGILAFGRDLPLIHDGGESSALDYLLDGGRLTGWIVRPEGDGLRAVIEPGSTMGQGHPDQWLGYLSQCGVAAERGGRLVGGIPLDTALVIGGRPHAVADLLDRAKADIRPGQEATWTLMALSAYEPPDAAWTAGDGTAWSVERVVAMEAEAEIFRAACGGAHRLYGLAAAIDARRRAGLGPVPADSGWAAAEAVLEECIDRARRFQQADGSFSTHSFERPATSPDVFARLSATGHVFEVLALALDDERLAEPWVTRAAERLVALLEQTADIDVECGGLYHAAHGLALYRVRVCP